MKLIFYFFQKTLLTIAAENDNINIVQLLLSCDNIDVNLLSVLNWFFVKYNSNINHLNYIFILNFRIEFQFENEIFE